MGATGDRPSFEERFEALAAISYRVGYRLVGDRSEAEDLAQEALARAYASWRKIAAYDEAWVGRVTVNLAIGRWRRHSRLVVGADPARDGRSAPAPDALERIELMAAVAALPRPQREVVALRYLADLPEAAVARALGCAPGTVKQHAHRGLAALRARLGHLDPRSPVTPDAQEQGRVRASG
jgi:RNA polymerase sigma-70 factor (sigma-E family)